MRDLVSLDYPFGGYASYFQEMSSLNQFAGLSKERAFRPLFREQHVRDKQAIKLRSSPTRVSSVKKPFNPLKRLSV